MKRVLLLALLALAALVAGGHSSMPPPRTEDGTIGEAIDDERDEAWESWPVVARHRRHRRPPATRPDPEQPLSLHFRCAPEPDLARVHGTDQRVSVDAELGAIRFYRTLIVNRGA